MKELSIKKRLLLVAAGLVFAVLILEAGLRTAGWAVMTLRERKNLRSIMDNKDYVILCLGGSTTAEGKRDSYPAHLERILNEYGKKMSYTVINGGVNGIDTYGILSRLDENLERYKPDMVLLMAGINDALIGPASIYDRKPWTRIRVMLKNIRVYKLARILLKNIRHRMSALDDLIPEGRNSKEEAPPEKTSGEEEELPVMPGDEETVTDPAADDEYLDLIRTSEEALVLVTRKEFEKAEELLLAAIERYPKNNHVITQLADMYILVGRYGDAEKLARKVIKRSPENNWALSLLIWLYTEQERFDKVDQLMGEVSDMYTESRRIYNELSRSYFIQDRPEKIEQMADRIMERGFNTEFMCAFAATAFTEAGRFEEAEACRARAEEIRSKYYRKSTRQNYNAIKERILEKGIRLICVQYPMRNVKPLKDLLYSAEGVLFVDNGPSFREAVKKSSYREYFRDMLGGDFGHATPRGNRLLAHNIARVILSALGDTEKMPGRVPDRRSEREPW